ncbi:MAG: single-stranded-DNA-specific exonuclease RecJ [Candidatus Saccharibacteria bacterium]
MSGAFKTKWVYKSSKQDSGLDLATQVLKNRGYKKSEIEHFLNPEFSSSLGDPYLLPDMDKAVKRVLKAISEDQKIVIYGDYDIDGITASALLHDFLTRAGANHVEVYIPDRFEEGYGLNSEAIKNIKDSGADLVISVDCGVTAVEQAKLAEDIQLDLIITDHHEPPEQLPEGMVALVNPKLESSKYPFSELAGVGVAFSLVRALLIADLSLLTPGQEKWLLDLVALGTICDVVPLIGENRVLASFGLKVMSQTRRVGLRALAEVSATEISEVGESDLGFRFGPRLNAAGRLEHARDALKLLMTSDDNEAPSLAAKLNDLNLERQAMTQEIYNAADIMAKKKSKDFILVMADKEWSHGIVGIVASRIAEKWRKPTILLQVIGDEVKGSARSYGGFSIIEALRSSSERLIQYGGHDFAAGMKLKAEDVDLFSYQLNDYAMKNIDVDSLMQPIEIDALLGEDDLILDRLDDIQKLRPFGNKNSQPIFYTPLHLLEHKLVGQHLSHSKFKFKTRAGKFIDGIAFSSAHKWPGLETGQTYNIAYYIQKNVWQNVAKLQLEVIDIKKV